MKHLLLLACMVAMPQLAYAAEDGEKLFNEKCTTCHAVEKAKMGPAVIDMNPDAAELRSAIADGVENGGPFPMPAFGEVIKPEQIDALVTFIRSRQQ